MHRLWQPLLARVVGFYLAGSRIDDLVRVCRWADARGLSSTASFWNGPDDEPREVADAYLATLAACADAGLPFQLSIKAPALGFRSDLVTEIAEQAKQAAAPVHFDSLGPEWAEQTLPLIAQAHSLNPQIGTTLPSRWRRSLADADQAIDLGLRIRVVKGQWQDPDDPGRDPREGFLALVDRLAGRARHVLVATHDRTLAREALGRLRRAGTACELELQLGLPARLLLREARLDSVPVRLSVPYGHGYLPYSPLRAMKNPRSAWWLLQDAAVAAIPRRLAKEAVPKRALRRLGAGSPPP